jgi:hypothetical protein
MDLATRHVRFGWWSLLVFATAGLVLESLHGFKVRGYLDTSNETRRLMWTLAHAHGALVGLINIVAGVMWRAFPPPPNPRLVSASLVAAGVLLPAGFFLGGVAFYGGDPGIGTVLVPIGALLLLYALFCIARAASASR